MPKQQFMQSKKMPNKKGISIVKSEKPIKQETPTSRLASMPTIKDILTIPQQRRKQEVPKLFSKVQPFLSGYLQKKQGSRVCQLFYKWGNDDMKSKIVASIKKNWSTLIKSKYAPYTIKKVVSFVDIDEIIKDATFLQASRQGALILDKYLRKYLQAQKGKEIIKKFQDLKEKGEFGDIKSEEILDNLAIQSIEKNYYTTIISKMILKYRIGKMFDEQKQKCLQFLISTVSAWVHDLQGIQLFIEVTNHSNSKQKKQLLKQFKGHIHQIITYNNLSYVAVTKLLLEVDDTVLVSKALLSEIYDLLPQVSKNKKLFQIIFVLFSPRKNNSNVLGKYQKTPSHSFCKKPQEIRMKELRNYLYEHLLTFLQKPQNLSQLCQSETSNRLIIGLVKSLEEDQFNSELQTLITNIIQLFQKDFVGKLNESKIQGSLIAHPSAHKIVKFVLSLKYDYITQCRQKIRHSLLQHFQIISKEKSSYVLLSILELQAGKGKLDWVPQLKAFNLKLPNVVASKQYQELIQKYSNQKKPAQENIKSKSKNKPKLSK